MFRLLYLLPILLFTNCQSANTNLAEKEKTEPLLVVPDMVEDNSTGADGPLETDSLLLHKKINLLYKRAVAGNFSTQYAVLADLGLHSGSKRIYLVKLSNKTVIQKALVTHGSSTTYQPIGQRLYSNVEGSLCSSLGVYKIGAPYQGTFGLAYKLFGLDKDNNNAYARAIVLHSHSCVPDAETEDVICQSWGCPTVSPAFLQKLAGYINASAKPMLLYMFDSTLK